MTLANIPRGGKTYFNGATEAAIVYTPPRDTCDPRARACTDHRVACDCREAEFAENANEGRMERLSVRQAFREVLAGHPTHTYDDNQTPCQCTGCRIARTAHIYV